MHMTALELVSSLVLKYLASDGGATAGLVVGLAEVGLESSCSFMERALLIAFLEGRDWMV